MSEKLNKKLHENRANCAHEKVQILKEHARGLKALKKRCYLCKRREYEAEEPLFVKIG